MLIIEIIVSYQLAVMYLFLCHYRSTKTAIINCLKIKCLIERIRIESFAENAINKTCMHY